MVGVEARVETCFKPIASNEAGAFDHALRRSDVRRRLAVGRTGIDAASRA
jgi:hypothetical protein